MLEPSVKTTTCAMRLGTSHSPKKPYVPRTERMTVDARRWLRSLALEPYWLQHMKSLQPGERLWLGWFQGPSGREGQIGHAEASIEAVVGGFRFHGVWTISPLRAFGEGELIQETFATGRFSLLDGAIHYDSKLDPRAGLVFANICRLIAQIEEEHVRFGIPELMLGAPYFHNVLWRCQMVDAAGRTREGCFGPIPFDFGSMTAPESGLAAATIKP